MKRVIATIVLLSANPLWALTFMGPATTDLEKGQVQIGAEYSTGATDISVSGSILPSAETFDDMDTDALLARLSASPFDNVEVYGRLGMAEAGDLDEEFAWGAGVKATVFDSERLPWGVLFQVIHLEGDEKDTSGPFVIEGDLDVYEYQIAVGPSYRAGNVCVYGGPFLHFIDGDFDLRALNQKFSLDVEQESEFGGYVGLAAEVVANLSVYIEGQFTSDADLFAASVSIKF
ncbi:MAG: hypothetical protein ACYSWO_26535 [Planctomycetota bacterium]